MPKYDFKRAGWFSIAFAIGFLLIGGSKFYGLLGAVLTAYIFVQFKSLLNFYGFQKSDKFIICFIIIGLMQILLNLLPSKYLLTVGMFLVVVKALSIAGLGITLFSLKESLFGYKRTVILLMICTGLSYITFALMYLPKTLLPTVLANYGWLIASISLFIPLFMYIDLGILLLKADKSGLFDSELESLSGETDKIA